MVADPGTKQPESLTSTRHFPFVHDNRAGNRSPLTRKLKRAIQMLVLLVSALSNKLSPRLFQASEIGLSKFTPTSARLRAPGSGTEEPRLVVYYMR